MRTLNKKAVAAATAGLVLVGGGVAYAYWTATGTGSGTGAAASGASNLVITQTTQLAPMHPGDTAQTLAGTVKNSGTNSAYVTSVTASLDSVSGAGTGGCDVTDFTLASPTMAIEKDVAAGGTETFSGATVKFNNKATNQDGCKGATLHISYLAQ